LRVPVQVSLVDLAPTVLDLVRIPVPPTMQGVSLVPLFRDPREATLAQRALFAELREGGGSTAVRTHEYKWIIFEAVDRSPEVYDLRADPGEHHNVATPEAVARGRALVAQYRAQATAARAQLVSGRPAPGGEPVVDPRTLEKLRALGYIH